MLPRLSELLVAWVLLVDALPDVHVSSNSESVPESEGMRSLCSAILLLEDRRSFPKCAAFLAGCFFSLLVDKTFALDELLLTYPVKKALETAGVFQELFGVGGSCKTK
jgi:hypothetical protein